MVGKSNLLRGKRVVITGGAGLLGRQFCAAVAQQGGMVIVSDLNLEAADKVAAGIVAEGGQAVGRALDITSADSVARLIDDLHAHYGGVDAVVNNAYPKNANYGRKFEDVEYADMCDSLSIHLAGYFLVAQKFAEYFKAHGGGNIVNMSSIYGFVPPRFQIYAGTKMTTPVEYALIKSGVIQLTRYIAQYYKGAGVRCNVVSPGGIADGQPESFVRNYDAMCAGKGMLDPQDIAGVMVFLLSDYSMYVDGQNLVVDDGFSL
jgi:NAD(P)-dependent dehydrogenase (short-subunit alcohol dehydrogenase family)